MALTQVPIELSSTPGIVDNSNATAITIDSSENVLVGATTVNGTGITLGVGNYGYFSRSQNAALFVNRSTDDGTLIELRKADEPVGSIGTEDNNIFIGTGDTGVRFSSGTDSVFPIDTSTGNGRDAAVDLGLGSGGRFKDLYLSGGAYLGGTGAANYLEDYEVGTFDLTISSSGFTVSSQTNTYTKIGNTVSIRGRILFSAVLSNGSSVVLTGAPFACNNNIHGVGVARETTTSGDIFTAQVSAGSTTFAFTSMDGITVGSNQVLLANKNYDYQVTYQT